MSEWERDTKIARYYNSNGIDTAIVAVVSKHNGNILDWAAYIGGSKRGARREEWAIEDVAKTGCKLTRMDAKHFFPALPIGRYRS